VPTLIENACWLLAPHAFVYVTLAVQAAAGVTVCSREAPPVPQPLQLQDPPDTGCGPKVAEAPVLSVAELVWIQVPLTLTYGVMVVGEHVWAMEGKAEPAPMASISVESCSLMVVPFR